jgi:hypothetical protein
MFVSEKIQKPIENELDLFERALEGKDKDAIKLYIKKEFFEEANLYNFLNERLKDLEIKPKRATKFKNFEAMIRSGIKSLAGKDDFRPAMMTAYFCFDRKEIAFTDAHKLVVIPAPDLEFTEDTYFSVDKLKNLVAQNEEDFGNKFPRYYQVIPELADENAFDVDITQRDIDVMRKFVEVCKLLGMKHMKVKIGPTLFDPIKVLEVIDFIKSIDPKWSINFKARTLLNPHVMVSNGYTFLIMPLLYSENDNFFNFVKV